MTEKENKIVKSAMDFVRKSLDGAEGGHDWWHAYRVWKTSIRLAEEEKAEPFTVQLAALLHDIADAKFYDGDEEIGPEMAQQFLEGLGVKKEVITKVVDIIKNISFKNSFEKSVFASKELDVVGDADRLDALGAIGIARTFNYGGHKGFALYDPDIPPQKFKSKEAYKSSKAPTVNHFYEKLFLLKVKMKTVTGKKLAEQRHRFMETYLEQFLGEWEGER
ncbi:MAG: HD domain-containing protein [Bacteroidales bacterium]|nr:HD domain-containing protein [Bacteroidales bacterium]